MNAIIYAYLDQKYSQRYKKNPFGAKADRFVYKGQPKLKKSDVMIEDETLLKETNMTRKFIDETIEKMKNDEQNKTSHQFKSQSKRFKPSKTPSRGIFLHPIITLYFSL